LRRDASAFAQVDEHGARMRERLLILVRHESSYARDHLFERVERIERNVALCGYDLRVLLEAIKLTHAAAS
jgi:hypothetical protein